MSKKKLINLNGNILPADQPVFTADNRAFRYGDGLFESIRMIGGEMPLFNLHFPRLSHGCELLKFKLQKEMTPEFFRDEILKLTEAQEISDNARIRLTIFRTAGGYYMPKSSAAEFLVEAESMDDEGFPMNEKGYVVDLFTDIEKPTTQFSTFKTGNALIYVLAAIHRQEHNLDDCLLINNKSRVIESIDSNLFIVRANEVHTPPVAEGCVSGVMREYIIRLLEKENIPLRETPLTLEELFNAEEMFLTNAIHGIRWIGQYKIKEYENFLSGKLSQLLNSDLLNRTPKRSNRR